MRSKAKFPFRAVCFGWQDLWGCGLIFFLLCALVSLAFRILFSQYWQMCEMDVIKRLMDSSFNMLLAPMAFLFVQLTLAKKDGVILVLRLQSRKKWALLSLGRVALAALVCAVLLWGAILISGYPYWREFCNWSDPISYYAELAEEVCTLPTAAILLIYLWKIFAKIFVCSVFIMALELVIKKIPAFLAGYLLSMLFLSERMMGRFLPGCNYNKFWNGNLEGLLLFLQFFIVFISILLILRKIQKKDLI